MLIINPFENTSKQPANDANKNSEAVALKVDLKTSETSQITLRITNGG